MSSRAKTLRAYLKSSESKCWLLNAQQNLREISNDAKNVGKTLKSSRKLWGYWSMKNLCLLPRGIISWQAITLISETVTLNQAGFLSIGKQTHTSFLKQRAHTQIYFNYNIFAVPEKQISSWAMKKSCNGCRQLADPGGLIHGLHLDDLLKFHRSMPRNVLISDAFFYSGLIENWGTGTIRIVSLLTTAGMPPAEFSSSGLDLKVTFHKDLLTQKPWRR